MHVGLSQVACERDDLDGGGGAPAPRPTSSASTPACRSTPTAGGSPARGSARREGDLAGAVALLDEAERVYVGDFSPNVRPVAGAAGPGAASRRDASTRPWTGRASSSSRPTTTCPTCASTSTSPWPGSCSHQHDRRRATLRTAYGLLERLRPRPRTAGGRGTLIEVLVLQALAHHAEQAGATYRARSRRWSARVRLAEPEGYVRVFVDEGAADGRAARGRSLRRDPGAGRYPRRLLDAVPTATPAAGRRQPGRSSTR